MFGYIMTDEDKIWRFAPVCQRLGAVVGHGAVAAMGSTGDKGKGFKAALNA